MSITDLLYPLIVTVGIAAIFGVIGLFVFATLRDQSDRPLIPWGARMRVERAKANLELDAIEVKRLAIEHQRTRVLAAIENGDSEEVQTLGLPSGKSSGYVETGRY